MNYLGSGKRKSSNTNGSIPKVKKRDPEQELLQDLIVKNLSLKATEADLADYFTEKCGELAFNEVSQVLSNIFEIWKTRPELYYGLCIFVSNGTFVLSDLGNHLLDFSPYFSQRFC